MVVLGSNLAPRWICVGQDGPNMGQYDPNMGQDDPKMAPMTFWFEHVRKTVLVTWFLRRRVICAEITTP
jgi:hypothetical protein